MANTFKNTGVAIIATGNITSGNNTNIYTATTATIFHALYISNVDTVNDTSVDLAISKDSGTTWFHIAKNVVVPAKSTLTLDKPINLETGNLLAASAAASGDVEIVGSLLEIS